MSNIYHLFRYFVLVVFLFLSHIIAFKWLMDIFLFENMCAENESLRGRTVKNITLTANSDKPKLRLN